MPSPAKKSGARGSTSPSKGETPSKSPVKEGGTKPSDETAQSKDSAQSAVSETAQKPELVKAVEKSPKSPLELAAEGGGVSPARPEIEASEGGAEAESSPDKIKKSVTTEGAEGSELVGSEEKGDVARSSTENPQKSETVSKTDDPPAGEVHSKSPKSSKEGDSAESLESSEKPEEPVKPEDPEKQEDVPHVPAVTVSPPEVEEHPEEESGAVCSPDRSGSEEPAAAAEEHQLEGDRHEEQQQAPSSDEPAKEGLGLRLMESRLVSTPSESTSRDIASGDQEQEQERLAANVEQLPAEPTSSSTAATQSSGMAEAGASGMSPELASALLEGLPYGRRMVDLVREREAALVFSGQVSQRLPITGPTRVAIRIDTRTMTSDRHFNILIDVSRYDTDNINIYLVGDKIDVYARQENVNDYGEEQHEFHQIFEVPDFVDASRFSASITSENGLFIQAPLRIRSGSSTNAPSTNS